MSDYERLTNKDWKENYDIFEDVCCDTCAEDCGECERNFNALVRLAELEDKIENGTLIVVNKPFVAPDYISNGKEYYAVKIAEERDLAINLTKSEAETKLKELQETQK